MMPFVLFAMSPGVESGGVLSMVDTAVEIVKGSSGVVVAFSAGVDSSLVALIARRALSDRSVAVTALSESLPLGELDNAQKIAREVGIRHLVVNTHEIENPDYVANTSNRCYVCKDTLYRELRFLANSLGFEGIVDGTHLDDIGDDRPGLRAAREAGVVSPLLKAGFHKSDVREAARLLGLSNWDKPAMPCLSSRVPHGESVTVEKLSMIGKAEEFIKSQTRVRELRVRYYNGLARIEVGQGERHLLFDELLMNHISEKLLSLGFTAVTLDMRGYHSKRDPLPEAAELVLPIVRP